MTDANPFRAEIEQILVDYPRTRFAKVLLRRRRDFARQRWPFGQHKIAVCRVAATAAPRISRVQLPMAVPFGLGPRRGICLYHRRCGAISFRQTRAPFGPHSDEDLRW